ncbi:hypothetical protein [Occallatibacter riparius]|uniref:Nickel/cobalt transporter regulator n=1 Tax=Occallatibacter riparius TaxID=1002689 RepID=A0A9J7BWV3_9BACT|nr:hypothetical protein [Occallatibacter riparius]UWZ86306.1 hypothetical protein MOP44_10250 [Occallatibacter riparius]
MHLTRSLARLVLCAAVLSVSDAAFAQGPPGHDHDNPGHGGMPPGQAKKHGYDEGMPPGQAKKFRFREEDRDHFYSHYREDADHWRGHHRPVFVPGHYVPQGYYMQPVPQSYWVGVVAAPPPGYRYGYYQGYVVAFNPTTRIIADVLDIVAATR